MRKNSGKQIRYSEEKLKCCTNCATVKVGSLVHLVHS